MRRRDLLRWMGMSTVIGAATRVPPWADEFVLAQTRPPTRPSFVPDVEIALRAAPGDARILAGAATRLWRFTGQLLKGPAGTLQTIPDSYLGIQVTRRETSTFQLPSRLSTFEASWQHEAAGPARRIALSFQAGQWQLGGRTFDMMDTAPDETVSPGSTQIWELANTAGMMGMQMAHPIHPHGRQFRVLGRQRESGSPADGKAVREGLTDEGWKDTVLVMPGETVRILVNFTRYPGLYLYHCHILEHEDMGMMRNFRVA